MENLLKTLDYFAIIPQTGGKINIPPFFISTLPHFSLPSFEHFAEGHQKLL
ncbi:hypothetical protein [uncultured Oscillibacter sp.]|uniref:hypothetical protein n=1 Tax=uncultured Oscillibacter sp. TaxID=876091 RepID=UPI002631EB9F|nr:hypothetical protein [uncultured Oscillibacter sp.]